MENVLETSDGNQSTTTTTTTAGWMMMENQIGNSFFFSSSAPPAPTATNVIRQGAKALPTLDDRKKNSNENNRFPSKGGNAIDKERIINIDTLNPYMNKFVEMNFFE